MVELPKPKMEPTLQTAGAAVPAPEPEVAEKTIWAANSPFMRIDLDDDQGVVNLQFDNGTLELEGEMAERFDAFMKTLPEASQSFFKKVDMSSATQIVQEHKDKMSMQQSAQQGPMSTRDHAETVARVSQQIAQDAAALNIKLDPETEAEKMLADNAGVQEVSDLPATE